MQDTTASAGSAGAPAASGMSKTAAAPAATGSTGMTKGQRKKLKEKKFYNSDGQHASQRISKDELMAMMGHQPGSPDSTPKSQKLMEKNVHLVPLIAVVSNNYAVFPPSEKLADATSSEFRLMPFVRYSVYQGYRDVVSIKAYLEDYLCTASELVESPKFPALLRKVCSKNMGMTHDGLLLPKKSAHMCSAAIMLSLPAADMNDALGVPLRSAYTGWSHAGQLEELSVFKRKYETNAGARIRLHHCYMNDPDDIPRFCLLHGGSATGKACYGVLNVTSPTAGKACYRASKNTCIVIHVEGDASVEEKITNVSQAQLFAVRAGKKRKAQKLALINRRWVDLFQTKQSDGFSPMFSIAEGEEEEEDEEMQDAEIEKNSSVKVNIIGSPEEPNPDLLGYDSSDSRNASDFESDS